jgi:hypothetical protein
MYQPMLFMHWKQVRLVLIPFVIAAFGLPLLSLQGLPTAPGADGTPIEVYALVSGFQLWQPLFPFLALAIGVVLALTSWNWDHQLNHVYALSLPLARWEYAMLKMGAGAALALVPAAALWAGAHVAAASLDIPEGLRAYPDQLALKFFLAIMLAYALLFAMAAGTVKTTAWLLAAVAAGFVGVALLSGPVGLFVPGVRGVNVLLIFVRSLTALGGPFQVFAGNWSLIDV